MSYDGNTLAIMFVGMLLVSAMVCSYNRCIKLYLKLKAYGFMNGVKVITASIVAAFTLSACSSNTTIADRINKHNEQQAEYVENSIEDAPDWFIAPPESSPTVVYVTGTGKSNNMSMARNKAILDAQSQLADQIHALVSSHTKQHIVEANDDTLMNTDQVVKKLVAEANLSGYSFEDVVAKPEGRHYRFYVLMGYPVGKSNLMLQDQRNQANMKRMLGKSEERFEELNREIKEHR